MYNILKIINIVMGMICVTVCAIAGFDPHAMCEVTNCHIS